MMRISLAEFREMIQGSTGPIVDGSLIPVADGHYLQICSASGSGWMSSPMSYELWTPEDFSEEYSDAIEVTQEAKA